MKEILTLLTKYEAGSSDCVWKVLDSNGITVNAGGISSSDAWARKDCLRNQCCYNEAFPDGWVLMHGGDILFENS